MVKHIRVADSQVDAPRARDLLRTWFLSWPSHVCAVHDCHDNSPCCRLAEALVVKHIRIADSQVDAPRARDLLRSWFLSWPSHVRTAESLPGLVLANPGAGQTAPESEAWRDDVAFLAWSEGAGASVIASQLKVCFFDSSHLVFHAGLGAAPESEAWRDDAAFLAWSEGAGASVIASQLKVLISGTL